MTVGLKVQAIRTGGLSTMPPAYMVEAVQYVGMSERDLQRFFSVAYKMESASKVMPIAAYVNRGRWLADCRDCAGAEIVVEDGLTMCVSCIIEDRGIEWRRVTFPAERREIEELLSRRRVENRNWLVEESVADLQRENQEHGI